MEVSGASANVRLSSVCLWVLGPATAAWLVEQVPEVGVLEFQAVPTVSVHVDAGWSGPCITLEEMGPREKELIQGHPV